MTKLLPVLILGWGLAGILAMSVAVFRGPTPASVPGAPSLTSVGLGARETLEP